MLDDPWLPMHFLGIAAGICAWAAAWVVYAARPRASMNRRLAVLLAIEGTSALLIGVANTLWVFEVDTVFSGPAVQAVVSFSLVLLPGAYLAFLATVPSPAARILRGWRGRALLALAGPGAVLAWFAMNGGSFAARGTWWILMAWLVAGGLVGLAFAVSAYLGAGTPESRTRAALYAVAFGSHDLIWAAGAALTSEVVPVHDVVYTFFALGTTVLGTFALVPLLAYGILKFQMLDLDLKIKVGIRRSVVAGAFVGVFFIVEQVSQEWVSSAYGTLAGVAAAGALLFAQAPLRRVASRVAERTLPGVASTPEYLVSRRLQVYRAAVEGVVDEGHIPPRGRELLDRLGRELEIAPNDAAAVEAELIASGPRGVAAAS